MSTGRLIIAMIVIVVLANLFGFLIHGVLLANDYKSLVSLMRPATEIKYLWILLGNVFFGIAFVWAYAYGVEDKPWVGQGLRFGILVWLVASVPWFSTDYATSPIPTTLFAKQLGFELINKIILGLVTAGIVRR